MLPADALHGCRTHCQTGKTFVNAKNPVVNPATVNTVTTFDVQCIYSPLDSDSTTPTQPSTRIVEKSFISKGHMKVCIKGDGETMESNSWYHI